METSSASPPDCLPPPNGSYAPLMEPSAGTSGTLVTISGSIPMFGLTGEYIPTKKVRFWWNLDPEQWPTALTSAPRAAIPGPVAFLGEADVTNDCDYTLQFSVPHGPAGTYPVIGLHSDENILEAAMFRPVLFELTH